MNRQAELTALLKAFVAFYDRANRTNIYRPNNPNGVKTELMFRAGVPEEMHLAVNRINLGDCGTAAIAVGHVFTAQTGESVVYWDNMNHGYLQYGDLFYDTMWTGGQADAGQLVGAGKYLPITRTKEELVREYLNCDYFGALMIREFCRQQKVEPPAELQVVYDNLKGYTEDQAYVHNLMTEALGYAVTA